MQIANPIYDVVFKYFMEDSKIAKILISSIIGEEIQTLSFRPQEFTGEAGPPAPLPKGQKRIRPPRREGGLTVYRIDFSARIKTEDGYKNVIIELQKAKFPTDIMRFRKYLGALFNHRVQVYQKAGMLQESNFNPATVKDQ